MLETVNWWEGGRRFHVDSRIRYSDRLACVFTARMRQLEAIHHWLAGYFQAAAIMLQLPGGADYECVEDDDENEGQVDEAAWTLIWQADRDMLLSILAECFERLGADETLMRQVPGGTDFQRCVLPVEFRLTLAEQDRNGVLNVVAECLDRLLVIPELDEEERSFYDNPEPPRRRRRSWWRVLSPASLARRLRRRR
jgi:hypothetical protein